jgi:hypothetical protein
MTITFCSQFWQTGFGKSGIQSSNGQPLLSHNLINVGGQGNPLFVEDDYIYKFSDDYMDEDEYALLLPTGIEEPFTLMPEYDLGLKKTQNSTIQLNNSKIQGSKMGNSSLQIKTDNADRFSGTKVAPNKKKSSASHRFGLDLSAKKGSSSSSSFRSSFVGHNASLYPQGIESGNPWLNSSDNFDPPFKHAHGKTCVCKSAKVARNGPENETLRKFRSFKQFDTVNDLVST